MKTQRTLLPITAAIFVSTLGADAPNAQETNSKLSPQALQEIAQVEAEIDRIETQTIERLAFSLRSFVGQLYVQSLSFI